MPLKPPDVARDNRSAREEEQAGLAAAGVAVAPRKAWTGKKNRSQGVAPAQPSPVINPTPTPALTSRQLLLQQADAHPTLRKINELIAENAQAGTGATAGDLQGKTLTTRTRKGVPINPDWIPARNAPVLQKRRTALQVFALLDIAQSSAEDSVKPEAMQLAQRQAKGLLDIHEAGRQCRWGNAAEVAAIAAVAYSGDCIEDLANRTLSCLEHLNSVDQERSSGQYRKSPLKRALQWVSEASGDPSRGRIKLTLAETLKTLDFSWLTEIDVNRDVIHLVFGKHTEYTTTPHLHRLSLISKGDLKPLLYTQHRELRKIYLGKDDRAIVALDFEAILVGWTGTVEGEQQPAAAFVSIMCAGPLPDKSVVVVKGEGDCNIQTRRFTSFRVNKDGKILKTSTGGVKVLVEAIYEAGDYGNNIICAYSRALPDLRIIITAIHTVGDLDMARLNCAPSELLKGCHGLVDLPIKVGTRRFNLRLIDIGGFLINLNRQFFKLPTASLASLAASWYTTPSGITLHDPRFPQPATPSTKLMTVIKSSLDAGSLLAQLLKCITDIYQTDMIVKSIVPLVQLILSDELEGKSGLDLIRREPDERSLREYFAAVSAESETIKRSSQAVSTSTGTSIPGNLGPIDLTQDSDQDDEGFSGGRDGAGSSRGGLDIQTVPKGTAKAATEADGSVVTAQQEERWKKLISLVWPAAGVKRKRDEADEAGGEDGDA